MDKLGDMDLFVRVVRNGGLAAAGREVGLSPARMTARMNGLEKYYGVRLMTRTTRSLTLTEEGQTFFTSCKRVLAEVEEAEVKLLTGKVGFTGSLRISSTSDLGQQHIAPLLKQFRQAHPDVATYLQLNDGIIKLHEEEYDLAVRYGVLADSSLVARRLAGSHRMLCAAPEYLKKRGTPKNPHELSAHDCLVMIRASEPLTTWHFNTPDGPLSINILQAAMASNDGALVRRWALEGAGIALKSYWDIKDDLKRNKLVTVLDDFTSDFEPKGVTEGADIHVIYPARDYLPERTSAFIEVLADYFSDAAVN